MKKLLRNICCTPRYILMGIIRLYQQTISPDHSALKYAKPFRTCKYSPTCSQYMYESIKKYGVVKGGIKGIWRVLRCNPFSEGGIDKVK